MGNSFSSSTAIWVQCDRPFYHAGDTVQGVVCLNCVKDLQFSGLDLKVTGYEKTQYSEAHQYTVQHGQETRTETRYVPHDGHKDFFKVTVPLRPAGTLGPGQYQFGFVFALPCNLPGTFSYNNGNIRANITYKVKACCHVPGMFKAAIKNKQELLVYQRMQVLPSSVMQSAAAEITFCCCFRRGHAEAQIHVDKDHYVVGEQARIVLQADNQSAEQFKTVEVRLMRKMTLQADGAFSRTVEDHCSTQSYKGVGPYTSLHGGLARQVPLPLPTGLSPTTHGQIITCDYWVEVTLKGGACVSDLKMKSPVVIHPPQPAGPFFAQPPAEWNPSKVYDPVAVNVPSAPPLPADALDPGNDFWIKAMGSAAAGNNGLEPGQYGGKPLQELI